MATPIIEPTTNIGTISPGNPVTVDFPIGYRYKAIRIKATVKNTSVAPSIDDILGLMTLRIGGTPIRTMTGSELNALNSLDAEEMRATQFGATGALYGVLVAPTVTAGTSSNFTVGDIIQASGGTGTPATFVVVTVSSGALATVRCLNPGAYTTLPTAANSPTIVRAANGSAAVGTATLALLFNPMAQQIEQYSQAPAAGGYGVFQAGDTAVFYLTIYLSEPDRKTYAATDLFALPTKWPDGSTLESLQLDIQVPNNAGTSQHAIEISTEKDEELGTQVNGKNILLLTKWKRSTEPYTGTGPLDITRLARSGAYQQISIFAPGGDTFTGAIVKVNSKVRRNVTKQLNDVSLIDRGMNELAIDPSRFDLVFDYTDKPTDGLSMDGVTELLVQPILATANAANKSLVLISRVYGGLTD